MADPKRGTYCKLFADDYRKAQERLEHLGGTFMPGKHDYEAWTYKMPGLMLVFYPHRTSADNQHIRVRVQGKANPAVLRKAIFALAENSCTFQFPVDRRLHQSAVIAAINKELDR